MSKLSYDEFSEAIEWYRYLLRRKVVEPTARAALVKAIQWFPETPPMYGRIQGLYEEWKSGN